MIVPKQSGDALLADIQAAREQADALHVWWLGQSGFLVQWQGKHLLFDPYLSDSLTRKYANTDKQHVRMTELVIEPERLDFVDVVTSSHNHTDHLDGETITRLLQVNPEMSIVVSAANQQAAAERLQIPVERLTPSDVGTRCNVAGFTISAVPSAHEELEQDDQGRHIYVGYIVEFGPWTVYHAGDTIRYEGMAETLRQWSIDLALLPINGSHPERCVAGNLWGHEAAQLAHDISAKLVVPCHYDMFDFNTVTPDEFVAKAKALGQPYQVLANGERFSSHHAPS